jgi:SAM-dependent methyltransferase
MTSTTTRQLPYTLGHTGHELGRLDLQAQLLEPATRMILTRAGLGPGMRVLDIGTGTGAVARLAAELVGPSGHVTGIDRAPAALEQARTGAAGLTNVDFREGDAAAGCFPGTQFDAVIGRLVLAYLPDPAAAVRQLATHLAPGGLVVAMEYDLHAVRTEPRAPLVEQLARLINAAFEAAGTPQTLGPHLTAVLGAAGLTGVQIAGIQEYLGPDDPRGPTMIASVVTSLLPAIERHGLAAATELDMGTLAERITAELDSHDAVLLMPTLVGAWGRHDGSRY